MRLVVGVSVVTLLLVSCVDDAPAVDNDAGQDAGVADVSSSDAPVDVGATIEAAVDAGCVPGPGAQDDPDNCGCMGHVCQSRFCATGVCAKRVFLTSSRHDGMLGGRDGADATCQKLAKDAGLEGTYFAWISTDTSSPNTHFAKSKVRYQLVDNVSIVVSSYADLIDTTKTLLHPITQDEKGVTPPPQNVWTQTKANGDWTGAAPTGCAHFFSNSTSETAFHGLAGAANAGWSDYSTLACDQLGHLYCFEQ